jgi:hypothetical protein
MAARFIWSGVPGAARIITTSAKIMISFMSARLNLHSNRFVDEGSLTGYSDRAGGSSLERTGSTPRKVWKRPHFREVGNAGVVKIPRCSIVNAQELCKIVNIDWIDTHANRRFP